MNKNILIGKIVSAFGIKGEIKILSYCQKPADIEKYEIFDKNGKVFKLKITNKNKNTIIANPNNGALLTAKIAEIENRDEAEKLCQTELFIKREALKNLAKNEFYQADLIGLDVVDEANKKIGKVINVMDFGAGPLLEIEFEKADKKNDLQKIENFPFKDEFFPEINIEKNIVKFRI